MFRGNHDPDLMPLPGDIVHREGAYQVFDLEGGWGALDTFQGEWKEGVRYRPGDVVTRFGAVGAHPRARHQ